MVDFIRKISWIAVVLILLLGVSSAHAYIITTTVVDGYPNAVMIGDLYVEADYENPAPSDAHVDFNFIHEITIEADDGSPGVVETTIDFTTEIDVLMSMEGTEGDYYAGYEVWAQFIVLPTNPTYWYDLDKTEEISYVTDPVPYELEDHFILADSLTMTVTLGEEFMIYGAFSAKAYAGMDAVEPHSTDSFVVSDLLATSRYHIRPIPEPATILLFGSGLIGLAGARRKFKKV